MGKPKKERNLKLIDGKWYVDFTFNKKRIRKFGGYTKEQARNTLAKMRIEKLDERLGFKKPKQSDIAFDQFAREFIEIYSKQNKKSWKRDEFSLISLRPFFKGKTIQDIGPEFVERYKAKRKTEVSPATVNRDLAFLKTMFNKAVEWGRLESSPVTNVKKFKEPNSKERILNASEMTRLIDAANNHLKPILIIALNTGMRRGEILSLKWENVNPLKRCIHLEDSKAGKSRDIPMNGLVVEALSAIRQDHVYVFYNPMTGGPLKDIKTAFKTACKNAEIKDLRFHDLRHTSATKMIEIGVDIVTLSRILGHSTIQMTTRYCNPNAETMKNAVDKLADFYEQTRQKVDTVEIDRPAIPLISDH
ncbi:MAG: tyrosine-type recombinase/integrase [Candidatus Bathyarchaeota archaeon]|nr:tyrosine-type recombinase/integrase [Candidatus Bathyarchaeota archaeon]